MDKKINVGIADMKIVRNEGVLITYALGSCIGISLYDPVIKLGALVHIMLPEISNMDQSNIFKYADSGLIETLRRMKAFGVIQSRLIAKIAGGAKMFDLPGNNSIGNIGLRNCDNVKRILQKERVQLKAEDTGSNYARTMMLDVATGVVTIRTFGRSDIFL